MLSGYEVLVVALASGVLLGASIAAVLGVVLRLVRGRVERRGNAPDAGTGGALPSSE